MQSSQTAMTKKPPAGKKPVLRGKARRVQFNALSTRIPRLFGVVPPRAAAILRYGQPIAYSSSASRNLVWRAAAYDPDYTGGGSQPLGFDQYMAFYGNYIPMRVRMTVELSLGSGASPVVNASLFPSRALTTPSTDVSIMSQPLCQTKVAGLYYPATLQSPWVNIWEFLGFTREEYVADDRHWGTSSADPTDYITMQLYATYDRVSSFPSFGNALWELDTEFFTVLQLEAS